MKYVKGAEDGRIVDAAEQVDKWKRQTYDELKTRVSDIEVEIAGSLMMDVKQLRDRTKTCDLVNLPTLTQSASFSSVLRGIQSARLDTVRPDVVSFAPLHGASTTIRLSREKGQCTSHVHSPTRVGYTGYISTPGHVGIQGQGERCTLPTDDDNKRTIVGAGGIQVMLTAMTVYVGHEGIQHQG